MIETVLGWAGWTAIKSVAGGISWKWIGVGLMTIAMIGVVLTGALHIKRLTDDLEQKTADLATETRKAAEADARADAIKAEHDVQIERINALEDQRTKIANEVVGLRTTIQNLDIEEDLASDDEAKADAAVDRLRARNRELNGMLNHASGGQAEVRSGPGAGSKAGPASAPSTLQRALEALRQKRVPDGK